MEHKIQNGVLCAEFSDIGGELLSLTDKSGLEYIWQGDAKYWDGRSPILFPYCCRLYGGHYTYHGEKYFGDIHGFIRETRFSDIENGGDFIVFKTSSNEKTRKLYPFDFEFELKYALEGNTLKCDITVKNLGNVPLYYCEGMHPGFNVPLDKTRFEDWYLEFSSPAAPRRILFSESKFCCGESDFSGELENGTRLALTHSLFDNEAIFLTGAARSVSIKSDISQRKIVIDYPDSAAVGFWQPEHTDAPFLCVEPLNGLPSFDGEIDDIEKKLFSRCVEPEKSHTDTVKITVF